MAMKAFDAVIDAETAAAAAGAANAEVEGPAICGVNVGAEIERDENGREEAG